MGIRRGERTSPGVRAAGLDPPNPASAVAQARPTSFAATAGAGRARVDAGKVSRRSSVGYDDREGRFLYATPALAAYMGMTPDQVIGRTWYEIGVPPEAVQALEQVRRRVLETGQPANHKTSLQIGGANRDSEFAFKPVIDAHGSIVGTVVTAWDASEHRQASRGRARLDRIYSVLSAIDQVILRARHSHVILSEACRIAADVGGFELAWVALVDRASGDVRVVCQAGRDEGLLADVVVSARDEPSGHGVVGTAIRENRSVVVQDVRRDKRMALWRAFFEQLGYRTAAAFPIRVADRTIGALVLYSAKASHFDAAEARLYEQLVEAASGALDSIETKRAKAEAHSALIESERRYRDLFEVNPQAMWVFDIETLRFLAVNNAAIRSFGYSREEFLAMTVKDIRPPEDVPALLEDVAIAMPDEGGYRPRGQGRHLRKDGSLAYVEVTANDIDFEGRPARLVMVIDVTDRRRLEAQLVEATRLEAMGHLAGGVAHDFNNLLTAVNGYADILIRELEGDERVESAHEIRRAGARAAELTKQVLAFARRQVLVPRPVDLNAVVASVSQMLRTLIGAQIRLVTNLDSSPAVVLADPGQLDQVLVNLAVNSRDAMLGGGVLEIGVRRVEGAAVLHREIIGPAVLLTVSDNGAGMDDATLARAFEPFFTTKEAGKGTGLGLATVYGIVRQSGGQIWAESAAGSGTKVSVLFPLVEDTPEPTAAPQAVVPEIGEGSCILAVEDDAAVRAFVVATLERAGYRVLVAASPAQAAALSEGLAETVDLLLTDLVMPGENGRDLAERLLVSRRSLRVVLMSGYDAAPPEDGHDDRFTFLAKPFGADELVAAVRQALAEPEA
jgi:two-component system, cell cycle sensor histidine kinase and response regulator CckA